MANDPSGWMEDVLHVPSTTGDYPDIASDGMYPQVIINHVGQGYMAYLRRPNPNNSWHFGVSRLGEIVQQRSIWDPAWHAGIDRRYDPEPGWSGYQAMVAKTGQANPNKWSVGIETEGFSIPAPGLDYVYGAAYPWPELMIESVIRIHKWIRDRCAWLHGADPENYVLTHSMFNDAVRAQDPGDLWLATVRPRILEALRGRTSIGPPSLALASARLDAIVEQVNELRKLL